MDAYIPGIEVLKSKTAINVNGGLKLLGQDGQRQKAPKGAESNLPQKTSLNCRMRVPLFL